MIYKSSNAYTCRLTEGHLDYGGKPRYVSLVDCVPPASATERLLAGETVVVSGPDIEIVRNLLRIVKKESFND